jgi:hypothetical protein
MKGQPANLVVDFIDQIRKDAESVSHAEMMAMLQERLNAGIIS